MMDPPKGKNQITTPQMIFLPMAQSCLMRLMNGENGEQQVQYTEDGERTIVAAAATGG